MHSYLCGRLADVLHFFTKNAIMFDDIILLPAVVDLYEARRERPK